jgi:hypothetical protein
VFEELKGSPIGHEYSSADNLMNEWDLKAQLKKYGLLLEQQTMQEGELLR